MEMKKMICFDMDGTIADFYGVANWKEMLEESNATPYMDAEPLWDMLELKAVLEELKMVGWEIRIITWLSMDSTEEYKNEVRRAKREWLERMGFPCDHFHGVAYGTTKADCVRKYLAENENAILFDDSDKVRKGWHLGEAINPTEIDIVEYLKGLLTE